jgi:CHC2-type zinc finger protein
LSNLTISQSRVSAREIIDRVSILDVMLALGFECPRRSTRSKCILHKGDGLSFSFSPDKGTWFCFRCNEGGGKIRLVQRALGLDSKAALRWLADLAGIPLDRSFTPEQRRDWGRRRREAEAEARGFLEWRDSLLLVLRAHRDAYFHAYHRAVQYIVRHGADALLGELAMDAADVCEARYIDLDRRIESICTAPMEDLIDLYRARRLNSATEYVA